MDLHEYIENHTLRLEASRRGGGIEVDASEALGVEGAKMTAYQNYLGGGLLGAIGGDANAAARTKAGTEEFEALATALKRYFHAITNEQAADYDEWADQDFEATQRMPESAY